MVVGGLPEQMLSRSSLEHPTLTLAHMVASQQQEHIWHQQSQGCAQPLSTQRQYDSGNAALWHVSGFSTSLRLYGPISKMAWKTN